MDRLEDSALTAAVSAEDCPPATQDIALNLKNRKNAIDTALYGPLNPAEPNDDYWQELAGEWGVDIETAKQQRCGNCAVFVVSPEMKECISLGLTGESESDEFDSIDEAGELGYCEAFDFKCASARTCRAWVGGGPVTAAGKKRKVAQTPAPKKDRIKGSQKNPKGSASGGKKIVFDEKIETSLKNKVEAHNKTAKDGRKVTLSMLKAVYRRGAGAYSTSHRPGKTRNQWAMARVNAFLKLVRSGKPDNKAYTTDNDLLPASHPRSSRKNASELDLYDEQLAEVSEFSESLLVLSEDDYPTFFAVEDGEELEPETVEVRLGQEAENELRRLVAAHNDTAPSSRKTTLAVAKAVYRRGGRAFSSRESSLGSRHDFAMKRVEFFLSVLRSGYVPNSLSTIDYDFLPARHPVISRGDGLRSDRISSLTAAGGPDARAREELVLSLGSSEENYDSPEDAILALTEALGMGYEKEYVVRSSWLRAVAAGEDAFVRALELVTMKYNSKDADLLPTRE